MAEFDESIIDIVDKLSRKLTHEQIHDFAVEFLEYVESVLDLDYCSESEESESDYESEGEPEEIEAILNDAGFYELK